MKKIKKIYNKFKFCFRLSYALKETFGNPCTVIVSNKINILIHQQYIALYAK